MRVEVKKYLFLGKESKKLAFFEAAQELGKIQFKDRDEKPTPEMEEVGRALKVLRRYEGVEARGEIKHKDAKAQREALRLADELEEVKGRLREVCREIERVRPFGCFDPELARSLKARFYLSAKPVDAFSIGGDAYFTLHDRRVEGAVEVQIDRSLSELHDEEKKLEGWRDQIEEALSELSREIPLIEKHITDLYNERQLSVALQASLHPADSAFLSTGWVPDTYVDKVADLASQYGICMEEVAPESGEVVPTYLENGSWGKVGEDLVELFDTPSHEDKDPSYWVLAAFALFFAFIIGDGGYGAVFLGLFVYLRFKHPNLKGAKRRMLNLGLLLSSVCVVWGVLTHAFFNVSIDIDSPMRKLSLITWLAERKADYVLDMRAFQYNEWMKMVPDAVSGRDFLRKSGDILNVLSDHVLLELSLFIGALHMLTGMFRYLSRNISLLGWILFLAGGYLYLPLYLNVPSLLHYAFHVPYEGGAVVGLYLMGIGASFATMAAIFKHGLTGIFEIMNGIGVFSDALSYLRLYALALAGSIVSNSINTAAAELPLIFAVLLILLAHLLNMGLGIMGGVIHGLRLNFLEWYHYSFEGGGKKFKPLERME